jgi:hypothetical protein
MATGLDDEVDDENLSSDLFSNDELPGTDRRTKVIALWGVGIVVAILVVTVSLVRLTDVGSPAPRDPATAAQQWMKNVVEGHRPEVSATCVGPAFTSAFVAVEGHPHIAVGQVRRHTSDHWTVTMTIDSPRQSVPVHVEKHSGRYQVC